MSILSSTYSGKKWYDWQKNLRWYAEKELYYLYKENNGTDGWRTCRYFIPISSGGGMTIYKITDFKYYIYWSVEDFINQLLKDAEQKIDITRFKVTDIRFSVELKTVLNKDNYEHSK